MCIKNLIIIFFGARETSDNFYITMRPGHKKNYHKMKMIIEFREEE